MKASWYAEALARALEDKSEKDHVAIMARFFKVMNVRGHMGLLKFIPAELEKIIMRDSVRNEVTLVTADEKSRAKWSHAFDHYEKEGIILSGADRHDVVDETIIGGYQIRSKSILIDSSYKKTLVDLYRNIVNTK